MIGSVFIGCVCFWVVQLGKGAYKFEWQYININSSY